MESDCRVVEVAMTLSRFESTLAYKQVLYKANLPLSHCLFGTQAWLSRRVICSLTCRTFEQTCPKYLHTATTSWHDGSFSAGL